MHAKTTAVYYFTQFLLLRWLQDNYVMRYKAGVAPPRQSNKRKSEYAYKFDWKRPVESTPILAADQVRLCVCLCVRVYACVRPCVCAIKSAADQVRLSVYATVCVCPSVCACVRPFVCLCNKICSNTSCWSDLSIYVSVYAYVSVHLCVCVCAR